MSVLSISSHRNFVSFNPVQSVAQSYLGVDRPKLDVGIDIDDVIYPTNDLVRQELSSVFKRHFLPPRVWDLPTAYGMDSYTFFTFFHMFVVSREGFLKGEAHQDLGELIGYLKQEGHKPVFVTARGCESHGSGFPDLGEGYLEVARRDTISWLSKQGYGGIPLVFTNDKSMVHMDILIDDGEHNLAAVGRVGTVPICFDQPYNASFGGRRISRLKEAIPIIDSLAKPRKGACFAV